MNKLIIKQINLRTIIACVLIVLSASLQAQNDAKPLIDLLDSKIYEVPEVFEEPSLDQGDTKAIFYETLSFKGKPTRAFAYIGIPKSDQPVPAMVLVHGGGGKAFHEWVKIWNDRGYAAISMSLEGHMPDADGNGKYSHEFSGPTRVGRFDDIELPIEEQWMYHAVSDIIIAYSLLESLPEIDAQRIGITGISWGGILSSLVSGVDTRLKCAIPVYGAGFLYESKGHFGDHGNSTAEFIEKKKFWDPANQFVNGEVPTLWVNGDSDGHFSLNITSHSYEVTSDHAIMSIHPSMKHGHLAGWDPKTAPEIYTFADQILKGVNPGLGRITVQPSGKKCTLNYESDADMIKASIIYLKEPLTYRKSENEKHPSPGTWITQPAKINAKKKSVKIQIPKDCMTYYVNLEDVNGNIISSVLVAL